MGATLNDREIALLAQKVENFVVGAPCGVMDQMTSALRPPRSPARARLSARGGGRAAARPRRHRVRRRRLRDPSRRLRRRLRNGPRRGVHGLPHDHRRRRASTARPLSPGRVAIDDRAVQGIPRQRPRRRLARAAIARRSPSSCWEASSSRASHGTTDPTTTIDPARRYPVRAATEHAIEEHQRVHEFRALLADKRRVSTNRPACGSASSCTRRTPATRPAGSAPTGPTGWWRWCARPGPSLGLYGAKITGGGSGGTVAVLAERGVQRNAQRRPDRRSLRARVGSRVGGVRRIVRWVAGIRRPRVEVRPVRRLREGSRVTNDMTTSHPGCRDCCVTGLLSTQAFAEDPLDPDADAPHNTEEPKQAEQPLPVLTPAAAGPPCQAAAAWSPPARPKFGDLSVSGYFRGSFGASNQKGRMTCFSARQPGGAALQVPARQRVRGVVRDALHDGDVRGRRRLGRDAALHADRLHPDDLHRLFADRRRQLAGPVSRPRPARRCPSPTSTPTSRASPGCSEERPGQAPATTSANPSTSATSSTGTPPAWARASRTSTSARTCGSATAAFAVDGEPASVGRRPTSPPLPPQSRLRRSQRSAASRDPALGERRAPDRVPVHRELQQRSRPRTADGASPSSTCRRCSAATTSSPSSTAGAAERASGRSARFYYPDFSLRHDPSESRLRVVDVLTIQPTAWFGAQVAVRVPA